MPRNLRARATMGFGSTALASQALIKTLQLGAIFEGNQRRLVPGGASEFAAALIDMHGALAFIRVGDPGTMPK